MDNPSHRRSLDLCTNAIPLTDIESWAFKDDFEIKTDDEGESD